MTIRDKVSKFSVVAKLAIAGVITGAVAFGWYTREYLEGVVTATYQIAPLFWALVDLFS